MTKDALRYSDFKDHSGPHCGSRCQGSRWRTGRLTPATDSVEGLQVVGLAGFEPATSSLSGMRSNQLSYRPPTGLASLIQDRNRTESGGADRIRTDDLLNANQALSQLSYSPD